MNRLLVWVAFAVAACAAETPDDGPAPYILEQQEISRVIINKQLAPNVMVLADTSSEMAANSRLLQLQTALHSLLTSEEGLAQRWALTTFPAPTLVVDLPPAGDVDTPGVLAVNATAVDDALTTITPSGTNDTFAAIQFAGELPSLNVREPRTDAIVLLTGAAPAGDAQATIDLISRLRSERGIGTIVVAFSPAPSSEAVFNEMARAGGGARRCETSPDFICPRAFYDETNATALLKPLRSVIIPRPNPCEYQFTLTPSGPECVSVTLDGDFVPPSGDTYTLTGSVVHLHGDTCERVRTATVLNPASIVIRAVKKH